MEGVFEIGDFKRYREVSQMEYSDNMQLVYWRLKYGYGNYILLVEMGSLVLKGWAIGNEKG